MKLKNDEIELNFFIQNNNNFRLATSKNNTFVVFFEAPPAISSYRQNQLVPAQFPLLLLDLTLTVKTETPGAWWTCHTGLSF